MRECCDLGIGPSDVRPRTQRLAGEPSTPVSKVYGILEQLKFPQLGNKIDALIDPESLLPCLQESAIGVR